MEIERHFQKTVHPDIKSCLKDIGGMTLWTYPSFTEEALQLAYIRLYSPKLLETEGMNPAQKTNAAC